MLTNTVPVRVRVKLDLTLFGLAKAVARHEACG